jgi:hypothetical protein
MRTFIVELDCRSRQLVEAGRMVVVDGHLYAMDLGSGVPPQDGYDAAWSPGTWLRFWPRPSQPELDRLRVSVTLAERAFDDAGTDEERERVAFYLAQARAELEQAEDRASDPTVSADVMPGDLPKALRAASLSAAHLAKAAGQAA